MTCLLVTVFSSLPTFSMVHRFLSFRTAESIKRRAALLSGAALLATLFGQLPAALADTVPTCNGLTATIYVDNTTNMIVGGPDNGQTFTGTVDGTTGNDVMVGAFTATTLNGNGADDTIC